MQKVSKKLKELLTLILSFIPTPLATGMTEFKAWQDDILLLSRVPDNDSTRFTVAVMVLHLGNTVDRKAKRYFVKSLNKAAANEIANASIIALKAAQEARRKEDSNNLQQASNDGLAQGSQV